MNEDLVLRVRSEGVEQASQSINTLKTGVAGLRVEFDTLKQSNLRDLAKDLGAVARVAGRIGGAAPQLTAMTTALSGYTQAAQAAAQATAQLRFGAAARSIGAGTTSIQAANQAVQGLGSSATGTGSALQGAGSASNSFTSSLKNVYGQAQSVTNQIQMVADKVQDVITGIVSLAQEGAKIQQLEVAFYKIGGSLDKLNELRDLTGGIVSDEQLVKSFNMMNLFELPQKEIPKLMKLAQGASIAMGQTANKMINDIATAASRRSRMIADNMGIVVDPLKVMYGNYAAKIGKAKDDLTDAEKTMAFTLNMIEKGGKQIELAGAAQANGYARAAAEYENATATFKKGIADVVSQAGGLDILREGLTELGAGLDTMGGGAATSAIKSIFGAAMEGAKLLPPVLKAVWPVVQVGLDLFVALAPILRVALELASQITAGFVVAVRMGLVPFANMLAVVLKGLADVAEFAGLSGKALHEAAENFAKFNANTMEMTSGQVIEIKAEIQPQLSVGAQFEKDVADKIKERQDKYKKESDLDLRLKLSLTGSSKAAVDSFFKEGEALIIDRAKITQDVMDKVAKQSVLELYKPDPAARKSMEQLLIEAVPEAFVTSTADKFAAVGERASTAFAASVGQMLPSEVKGLSVQMVASSDALSRSLLSGMGASIEDLAPGEAAKIIKSMSASLVAEAGKGEAEELLKALSSGLVKGGRGDLVTDAHSDADFKAMTAAQQVAVLQQRIADEGIKFADKAAARIWDAQVAYEQTRGGIVSVEQLIAKGSIGKVAEEFKLAFSPETLKGFKGELKLIDGAVSGLGEAIKKLKEKTYGEDAISGAYGDILDAAKEAGLLKQQNPFALVSPSDIDALVQMGAEIQGIGEKGELLTGSMGQAANAWRVANGDVDAAKAALKSYAEQLQFAEQRLVAYRTQLEGTGGLTNWVASQIASAQQRLAGMITQTKTAAEQVSTFTDSKPNKGKKNKNDILDRAELIGLSDYQKEIVAINRQFHKDMKDAGKNVDLQVAASAIQAANIAKAQKEMWEPVLESSREMWSKLQIGLAEHRIEAAKMLKEAQTELRINSLSSSTIVDPLDMIGFSKANLKASVQSFFKGEGSLSSLVSESIKDVQAILGTVKIRPATEEEKNIERQLVALRTEQEEKLSILTEGSAAYLAVKATFMEREAALERQRSAIVIEEEHKRVWAGADAFAQLQSETANFNSYIDGMTQQASRNTAFFAEGLLGGMAAVKGAADQMAAIDQQLALGTIEAGQAESKKMQSALGASGKLIAGFIKDQRAQAGVLGAMEIGHSAASFAGYDYWGGAAHLLAAAKYFAVAGSSSGGGGAGARAEPPRRATALSNRDSKGGGRERQSRETVNIIVQPITGQVIVREANKAAARNVNVKFHGGLMGGEFRRTDY